MLLYNIDGKIIGELYEETTEPEEKSSLDIQNIFTTKKKMSEIFYDATPEALDAFYQTFNEYADAFNVTTEFHENAFLAQIVAETGYALVSVRENLNYSCSALKSMFSYYKNNPKEADADGRCNGHTANQVNIGNKAYANRLGNGSVSSGDGYIYRGGGFFQLTGRGNYDRMAEVVQKTIGEKIDGSNLVSEITNPAVGVLSALAFWLDNGCADCTHIDCVTKKINYYTDSYDKRKKIYQWIAGLDN